MPASVWGCVLVFDVKVDSGTRKLAKEVRCLRSGLAMADSAPMPNALHSTPQLDVKILHSDVVYRLLDNFTLFVKVRLQC